MAPTRSECRDCPRGYGRHCILYTVVGRGGWLGHLEGKVARWEMSFVCFKLRSKAVWGLMPKILEQWWLTREDCQASLGSVVSFRPALETLRPLSLCLRKLGCVSTAPQWGCAAPFHSITQASVPGLTVVTPSPTLSTTPTASWPTITGNLDTIAPFITWSSVRQIPVAKICSNKTITISIAQPASGSFYNGMLFNLRSLALSHFPTLECWC